jgi:hypothetical protein
LELPGVEDILFTMATVMQKIKDIEDEMAKTQKNKATAHHLGLLKVISYLDTLRQSRVCGARMLIMMIQLGFFFFLSLYQRHKVCDFLAGRCCGFFICLLRCSFVHVSHQWLID